LAHLSSFSFAVLWLSSNRSFIISLSLLLASTIAFKLANSSITASWALCRSLSFLSNVLICFSRSPLDDCNSSTRCRYSATSAVFFSS
uniref:Secreted protein n=1 Tax=Parascaris equorum TaxID=6256 RepID=A0A914S2N2_PAREQ